MDPPSPTQATGLSLPGPPRLRGTFFLRGVWSRTHARLGLPELTLKKVELGRITYPSPYFALGARASWRLHIRTMDFITT